MLGATFAGLVLAAGAGERIGMPKALLRVNGKLFTTRAVETLREAGASPIFVVLGASEYTARMQLIADIGDAPDVVLVSNPEYAEGIASSVRSGLLALEASDERPEAAVVLLVDMPGIRSEAVEKLAARTAPEALAVATWDGSPVHPILLGRDHWGPVAEMVHGDVGARQYFVDRDDVQAVPCDGLGSPKDIDTQADLLGFDVPITAPGDILRAEVTTAEIQVSYLQLLVQDNRAGAVVSFDGTVRDHDQGRIVADLHYLHHPTAAEVMKKIVGKAAKLEGVRALAVEHRVGQLKIGETAFGCVVSAEHRGQAFDACRWIVEEVKSHLPIWKRQVFVDGTDEWVNSP